jgi:hypothetical protein
VLLHGRKRGDGTARVLALITIGAAPVEVAAQPRLHQVETAAQAVEQLVIQVVLLQALVQQTKVTLVAQDLLQVVELEVAVEQVQLVEQAQVHLLVAMALQHR